MKRRKMMLEVREQLVKRKNYERFLSIEEHSGARDLRTIIMGKKMLVIYLVALGIQYYKLIITRL